MWYIQLVPDRPEGYVYKTVSVQIFSSNAKNNSFQLVRTAFPSSFFLFFFRKNRGFFLQGTRSAIIGLTARAFEFQTDARAARKYGRNLSPRQTHSQSTDSMLRARSPLLHFKIPHTPSPPPLPESLGALIRTQFSRTWHFLSNCSLFSALT